MKGFTTLFLGLCLFSCTSEKSSVKAELTPIQKERLKMHQEVVSALKYDKVEAKLRSLSKKTFAETSPEVAEKRIRYAWRLGKMDQLKKDIPAYLNSKALNELGYYRADWRLIIHMWEHEPSEWARFVKMTDELYDYFKKTGHVKAEQKMLGAKIQGAHLMGDTLNEQKYLLQMLAKIGQDDERYEIYYSMLGWWYQDHGYWDKSVLVFRKQYQLTKSSNMLSSLVWGLFNTSQFEEVLKYEEEILQLKEPKMNYILAKSFQGLGKEQQAKDYFETFSKQNHLGSDVVFYFTDRKDNKFFLSDESYLIQVAAYFSTRDSSYACRLNKHIYDMIRGALNSNYAISLERKVILAQELPELQQEQNKNIIPNVLLY